MKGLNIHYRHSWHCGGIRLWADFFYHLKGTLQCCGCKSHPVFSCLRSVAADLTQTKQEVLTFNWVCLMSGDLVTEEGSVSLRKVYTGLHLWTSSLCFFSSCFMSPYALSSVSMLHHRTNSYQMQTEAWTQSKRAARLDGELSTTSAGTDYAHSCPAWGSSRLKTPGPDVKVC